MDRERYLEWTAHQLEFFAVNRDSVTSLGHRRSARIDDDRELVFEAHPDGALLVAVETRDEDRRARWAELFRRARAGQPPWPPGPSPEEAGLIELASDATGRKASLHFRWTFLGQDFRLALPVVTTCLSWLLLCEPLADSPGQEIELPEDSGDPLEIEWD